MDTIDLDQQTYIRRLLVPAGRERHKRAMTSTFDRQQYVPVPIPLPAELPTLPASPRVGLFIDGDCVSRGLVEGTARSRASDREVNDCLAQVLASAMILDPHVRSRCACSLATAIHHLDVLTSFHNNMFSIRRGWNGANSVLLEELIALIEARSITTTRPRRRPGGLVDLVILVGQHEIYAKPLRQLRLLGVPGWVLTPGRLGAASLRRAACALTYIGSLR